MAYKEKNVSEMQTLRTIRGKPYEAEGKANTINELHPGYAVT